MNPKLKAIAAACVFAGAPYVAAQTATTVDTSVQTLNTTAANKGQTQVAGRIAANFVNLAGSEENALALVNALRTGSEVTLGTEATLTPPTGKMGWGNVFISLALAQDSLTRAGITTPTSADLQAALLGGEVTNADGTTTTLTGVLQMRADGMGWGRIAQASGTKLGPVVSAIKSTQSKVVLLPTATATSSSIGATTAATGTTLKSGASSRGITTAASGTVSTTRATTGEHAPKGNAYGRGVVTAAGGGAGLGASMASANRPAGAGVVTASGAAAASTAASSAITTGQGGGHGQGAAHGNGKGKGGG